MADDEKDLKAAMFKAAASLAHDKLVALLDALAEKGLTYEKHLTRSEILDLFPSKEPSGGPDTLWTKPGGQLFIGEAKVAASNDTPKRNPTREQVKDYLAAFAGFKDYQTATLMIATEEQKAADDWWYELPIMIEEKGLKGALLFSRHGPFQSEKPSFIEAWVVIVRLAHTTKT
jgi:hypothetical protein